MPPLLQNTASPAAAFWHTTPLHYVPLLLHTGALYAQARLAALRFPVLPRPTATRRDRKLGLDGFVHFSFAPDTPLLADKHKKGYPHVLLQFDLAIADLPGAAFVPYNAKAFRHRDAFVPITNAHEKAAFLREREETNRFPSAELLIPGSLPLTPHLVALHTETPQIAAWIGEIMHMVQPPFTPPNFVSPAHFGPPCAAFDWEPFRAYGRTCASWRVLADAIGEAACPFPPPPNLPFD